AALDAERAELERAPLSLAEVEQRIRQEVARIGEYALGNLRDQAIRPSRDLQTPRLDVTAEMLVALDPEGFVEKAMAYLRSRTPKNIDPAKREKRLAENTKQRAELEEAEEREVLALEAEGYYVVRRADVDPRLVERIWTEDAA